MLVEGAGHSGGAGVVFFKPVALLSKKLGLLCGISAKKSSYKLTVATFLFESDSLSMLIAIN